MGRVHFGRILCCACTSVFVAAVPAPVDDPPLVWVNATTGNDGSGDGDSDTPYRTINRALVHCILQNGPEMIMVRSGNYTRAHEDDYTGSLPPFPIDLPVGTDLVGAETPQSAWPRLGGDIADSNVRAIVEVIADTQDRVVLVDKLTFAAENSSGEDAPGAIYIESSGAHQAAVTMTNCLVERSAMNDSGAADKPAIRAVAGRRREDETPSLILTIDGCPIGATAAGGVVVDLGLDADSLGTRGYVQFEVTDCSFVLDGSEGALSAIDYVLEGYDGSDPLFGQGECTIRRNVIDSRPCSGEYSRFAAGIRLGGVVKHGARIDMNRDLTILQENDVRGCAGAGVLFLTESDGSEDAHVEVQSFFFHNNRLRDNLGSGLVLDWGDAVHPTYLRVVPKGCLIVDNHDGIELRDAVEGIGLSGSCPIINCTIAGNTGYGVKMVAGSGTLASLMLDAMENTIVYDNGWGSATGWEPCDASVFAYNDYEGLCPSSPCTCGSNDLTLTNIDSWPVFVDADNGDYHIDEGSDCIDAGDNRPEGGGGPNWAYDIDGRARKMDGDHPNCEQPAVPVIDIGADEFPDPCAE